MKYVIIVLLATAYSFSASSQAGKTSTFHGIVYESRTTVPAAPDCNPSEVYLKKKVKALVANNYKDYPYISVDFKSFKGQKGYSDSKDPKRIVYPFKMEFTVYLRRSVMKEGKQKIEVTTMDYDAVYEYASKPEKKCEFYMVPSTKTRVTRTELF
jgi:hypothetical protein